MKYKKAKVKNYYQVNKGKIQKGSRKYNRNLSEDGKVKKRSYNNVKNKLLQVFIGKPKEYCARQIT